MAGLTFANNGLAGCALRVALAVLAASGSAAAFAQGAPYPSRTVRIVVPFPPGNASDLGARAISDALAARLKQPVIVDNRAGASGAIGADAVAKAAPDGYTLMVTSTAFGVTAALTPNLPYNAERDLIPVARVGWTGMMLVAAPGVSARTVADLVAALKKEPGKLNYAHLGNGALSHMTMELFKLSAGVDVVGVPYKGSGQALADMIGGQLSLMFDGATSSGPQVKAGRLKGIAISSGERSRFFPEIPTLAESGIASLKDFDVKGWILAFAPAGTPRPIIDRLHDDIAAVVETPAILERMASQNIESFPPASQAETAAYLKGDIERWRRVVREAKVTAQ